MLLASTNAHAVTVSVDPSANGARTPRDAVRDYMQRMTTEQRRLVWNITIYCPQFDDLTAADARVLSDELPLCCPTVEHVNLFNARIQTADAVAAVGAMLAQWPGLQTIQVAEDMRWSLLEAPLRACPQLVGVGHVTLYDADAAGIAAFVRVLDAHRTLENVRLHVRRQEGPPRRIADFAASVGLVALSEARLLAQALAPLSKLVSLCLEFDAYATTTAGAHNLLTHLCNMPHLENAQIRIAKPRTLWREQPTPAPELVTGVPMLRLLKYDAPDMDASTTVTALVRLLATAPELQTLTCTVGTISAKPLRELARVLADTCVRLVELRLPPLETYDIITDFAEIAFPSLRSLEQVTWSSASQLTLSKLAQARLAELALLAPRLVVLGDVYGAPCQRQRAGAVLKTRRGCPTRLLPDSPWYRQYSDMFDPALSNALRWSAKRRSQEVLLSARKRIRTGSEDADEPHSELASRAAVDLLSFLPTDCLVRVCEWLALEDLIVLRAVSRRFRDVVTLLEDDDRRYWFACGAPDYASVRQRPFTGLLENMSVDSKDNVPCTCGQLQLQPGSLWAGEPQRGQPGSPYGARHETRLPPARWKELALERQLACEIAQACAILDARTLEGHLQRVGFATPWIPAWVYLPPDVVRPTTSVGLGNLLRALLRDLHDDDLRPWKCHCMAAVNRVDTMLGHLASPDVARRFYREDAAHDGARTAAARTAPADDDGDAESGEADSAHTGENDGGSAATGWSAASDDEDVDDGEWLDTWQHIQPRPGQRPGQAHGRSVDGMDDDGLYIAEPFYSAYPCYRKWPSRPNEPWLRWKWATRKLAAAWRHALVSGRSEGFRIGHLRTDDDSAPFAAQSDAEVTAYLDGAVGALDRVEAFLAARCSVVAIVYGGSEGGATWIAGLSPRGHIVGAMTQMRGAR